jgi:cytochrome c oxidase cbb3-type subunit 3
MLARALSLFGVLTFAVHAADGDADRGARSFAGACGFCHGNDASGSRAPDLIRSPITAHDVNGDLLGPVIRQGRVDKGMPAFPGLAAGQVADMVAFLHAQQTAALHTNRVPRDYPLEKLLTGNAAKGKAYFDGAGGCKTCHSPTGDLAKVAGKYSPLDLQSKFLYPAGARTQRSVVMAAVTLASGEKVTGKVARVDDFEIAIRDKEGWFHSWNRQDVKVEINDPLKPHRDLLTKYTDADIHDVFAYLETLK